MPVDDRRLMRHIGAVEFTAVVPGPELKPYVRLLWAVHGDAAHHASGSAEAPTQVIAPDGCMELVLNLSDPVRAVEADGTTSLQPRSMLVGETRRPVQVRPEGRVDMVGVRFAPAGIRAFADMSAAELVDRSVPMSDVFEVPLTQELLAAVDVGTGETEVRLRRVEATLLRKVRRARRFDPLVARVAQRLDATGGLASVAALAHDAGLTPRQLERRFADAVGMSPKQLGQVLRFQRVLATLQGGRPGWVHVAAACGYYDQAHLIRDFKRFTGRTPRAFLGESHPFAGLFLPTRDDVAFVQSSAGARV